MRKVVSLFLLLFLLVGTAPAWSQPIGQYNPINTVQGAAGANTVSVTISGVSGQRVRIYHIVWKCNAAATTVIPTLAISDAGNTLWSTQNRTGTEAEPVGDLLFVPGWTGLVGGTVVVTANTGGACGGGTTLNVQADQF